ncbi:MAG: hypothetical protein IPH75_04070 [bacterium]|nr:hypothetical protein [bacterium]
MSLRICLYEDDAFDRFFPLTLLRPVYLLRAGILPLFKRALMHFPEAPLTLIARDQVTAAMGDLAAEYPLNIIKHEAGGEVLFLNGRIRSYGNLAKLVNESRISTKFTYNGEVVAVLFKKEQLESVPPVATQTEYLAAFNRAGGDISDFETTATLYQGWWELVADIESAIAEDAAYLKASAPVQATPNIPNGVYLVNKQEIQFGSNIELLPGSVLDASKGPIVLGDNVRVESHAAVIGPCYIGSDSVVVAGKVVASSIGSTCRVGGEVEESIFQSYVNKFHAGFIGHSYVGSWVNFGAMTTNSDLKNNYSTIRVAQRGEMVDTGMIKVGSCIGDHTKFGIGTLLNTGITIGVCCNIFGAGLTADKEVGSFQWGNSSAWQDYQLEKAVETAVRSAGRRKVTLSDREITLLDDISHHRIDAQGSLKF